MGDRPDPHPPDDRAGDILGDPERLAALERSGLLDSPEEAAFDRLTRLASRLLGTPVSLISLVSADRQFFKSRHGLADPWASERSTPLTHTFCQYVVRSGEPLVVTDARTHPLVAGNAAIADLDVIAYAGVPLSAGEHRLGSFCVIAPEPRDWTDEDIQTLTELAALVMTELELRRTAGALEERARLLAEGEARFRAAFAQAPIGVGIVGLHGPVRGRWLEVNHELERLLGATAGGLDGASVLDFVHPEDAARSLDALEQLAGGRERRTQHEQRLRHVGGGWVWTLCTRSRVDTAGGTSYAIAHYVEIGERKRYEAELHRLAHHDPVTGLLNRRSFDEELERALAHHARYGTRGALLAFDLDGFKTVNDTAGHAAGDDVLLLVSAALAGMLRSTDVLARVGGDEFAIILPEVTEEQACWVAEKVLRAVRRDAQLGPSGPVVTASIGIVCWAGAAVADSASLLACADTAMYAAKAAGGDRYAVHTGRPSPGPLRAA
jgi:diguanylate cyclase (GGDEF)-like protein/PAS domain S-box-containing protein